ncbi:tRNA pseudouridine synthase B [Bienertia sinuspersici]
MYHHRIIRVNCIALEWFLWGEKIKACIKRSMIMAYQFLLYEGESYITIKFGVKLGSGDYKTTSHGYKINF